MDIGFFKHDKGYKEGEVTIFHKSVPNSRATLAIELISRWGLVAGVPDGEDSKGRAKVGLMPIADLVARACDTADLAISDMEDRGWFLQLPDPDYDSES